LFDTFEGMTPPTDKDTDYKGADAHSLLHEQKLNKNKQYSNNIWCYADMEDVQHNIAKTNYPVENIHYIKGMVEQQLPYFQQNNASERVNIALLRLDTDWYESTRVEMEILYPMLVAKGILILDDYGYWRGAREAVDEYIENHKLPLFLSRIDREGRLIVKPN
jgi:hypothetical protein